MQHLLIIVLAAFFLWIPADPAAAYLPLLALGGVFGWVGGGIIAVVLVVAYHCKKLFCKKKLPEEPSGDEGA